MEMNRSDHPRSLTLGISSCLLGEEVRFDGNHKRDAWIVGTLGRWFEFHPVCPEMAIGLGVPRPPIRLQGDPASPQVVGVRDETLDVTEELEAYSRETAAGLEGLSGYILKAKSPSCGMERVKVYRPGGGQPRMGQGVFARALMEAHPDLPVEEEGRLGDPDLRDNFLERIFAHHRWQTLQAEGLTPARLQDFHRRHKLTLMAHGQEHYRRLGQRVAAATGRDIETAGAEYFHDFMGALRHKATRRRHVNVLQHIMGYLKRELEPGDKAELLEVFEQFRQELVPLSVPLTLLKHHFRHHPSDYMADQVYLDPYPAELMLR